MKQKTCKLSIKKSILTAFFTLLALHLFGAEDSQPGLITHYYGNPNYFYYVGTFDSKDLDFNRDMKRLKWLPYKHGVFSNRLGWSTVTKGSISIPQTGKYQFKWQGPPAALRVGDQWVDVTGETWLNLSQGVTPLALYVRSDTCGRREKLPAKEDWIFKGQLTWKTPQQGEFSSIPSSLLFHTPRDGEKLSSFLDMDVPLTNMRRPFIGARDFDVEIPADGFYRFILNFTSQYPWIPRYANIFIDGKMLLYYKSTGDYDWFNALYAYQAPCYLTKGRHAVRVHTFSAHLYHTDSTDSIKQMRMGFLNVSPTDPEVNRLVLREADRRDMVFRKGEGLKLRLQGLTSNSPASTYSIQVSRQRDDSRKVIWQKDISLEASEAKATAEITYPCDEEGAFEYVLVKRGKDAKSAKVISGPWSFAVVDPTPIPIPRQQGPAEPAKVNLVDSIDCTVENDTEHKFRDNGTSKVVQGPYGKYRQTENRGRKRTSYRIDPKSKKSIRLKPGEKGASFGCTDMDWFGYTMKVKHPGRPHMLTTWIPNDQYREVGIQAFDPITTFYSGAVLSTRETTRSEHSVKLSFLVWPNGKTLDILAFDDSGHTHDTSGLANRIGAVQRFDLYEFPDGLTPLPQAAEGWNPKREAGWSGEQVDLGVEQRVMAKGWNGSKVLPATTDKFAFNRGGYLDWKAMLEAWNRFGQFCMWRGDNLLVWPVLTYGMTHIFTDHLTNAMDIYGAGTNFRPIDRYRRDQLKLILLVLEKYNMKMAIDFQLNRLGADTVIAANPDMKNINPDDLVLIGTDGKPYGFPGKILNPAHPLAKKYLVDMYEEIAKKYASCKAFAGINTRHWTWTSGHAGWFVKNDSGYGDFTTTLFEKETGVKIPVESNDPQRFQKRFDWLMKKPQRDIWFQWRADKVTALKEAQLAAIRKHAPHAQLYGTPDVIELNLGSGLDHNKLKGRKDLGFGIQKKSGEPGTEINKLDPITFANFDIREPAEVRATKDIFKTGRERGYATGLCSGHNSGIRCRPYQLEEPASFLSEGPLDTLLLQGMWILPPMDEGIRRFIRAFRTIPSTEYRSIKTWDSSVYCWYGIKDGQLVFYLASQSDRPQAVSLKTRAAGRSLIDMVTGETIASSTRGGFFGFLKSGDDSFDINLTPFQLRVFKCSDAGNILALDLAAQNDGFSSNDIGKEQKWQVPDAEYCRNIHLGITEPANAGSNWLTVSAGELMRGLPPELRLPTDGVVAYMSGNEVPLQIDEKDGTGDYVLKGNGSLDYDDEILVRVNLSSSVKVADIQIYFGSKPLTTAEYETGLTVKEKVKLSHATCAFQLKNKHLSFAVMPKAPEGPRQNKSAWWHQGLVNSLVVDGKDYLSYHRVHTHIPGWWTLPIDSIRLVSSGPLRKIVETRYKATNVEHSLIKNRIGYLRNATHIVRYELREDSPVIRLGAIVTYDKTLRVHQSYWPYLSAAPGGKLANDDTLVFFGTSNEIKTIKLTDMAKGHTNEKGILKDHVSRSSSNLIAAYNPGLGGLAYIGSRFNNRLRAELQKGASLSKCDRYITFGVFYDTKDMPPKKLEREYWVIPLKEMNPKILVHWQKRYNDPLELHYGSLIKRNTK